MRRQAALLVNPRAGQGRERAALLQQVIEALRRFDVQATPVATAGPGTAGEQARELCRTSEIVFACGGDGTVHEALQGLAGQTGTTLGIVPLGSANVLAKHLRLPVEPVAAVVEQMKRAARTIPLGEITYTTAQGQQSRYFAAVAGAGADGLLASLTSGSLKQRWGRWAYPLRAGHLCLQRRMTPSKLRVSRGKAFRGGMRR